LDGEGPIRFVNLKPYRISETAVTNRQFAAFIAATGHVTDAERYGWSYVFQSFLPKGLDAPAVQGVEWWRAVTGAKWDKPEGEGSDISGREEFPVVHVSWLDASAYASWVGGRLPTEVEWEHAARGGLPNPTYPWGEEDPNDTDTFPCNIWQGHFPTQNTGGDGYFGLAPARSFESNGFGLYNMSGNCWEWTADPFFVRSLTRQAKERNSRAKREKHRVLKGGSYLCHKTYCFRYRIAARIGNTPETTTGHTGFRVAFDAVSLHGDLI
jgi:formylglycine-generating enzyme required for sulfatase activity